MSHNKREQRGSFSAVDLFAGGGGLTVGLKAAGFNVVSAIEMEHAAFSTYKTNHPDVHCYRGDVQDLNGNDLTIHSPTGRIDLIAGCPPCQGFTSLTSKYRREDKRNALIGEMLRLILELKPRAVMLENVPRLTIVGKSLFDDFRAQLEMAGYKCNFGVLEAADFGVPQTRRRLVFVAGLGFQISLPNATHSKTGKSGKPRWRTVSDALLASSPSVFGEAKKAGRLSDTNWHVVRKMSKENLERLKWAQPGKSWRTIPEHLRPNCHRGDYSGFSNVYGRMDAQEAAPTITGGCTNLSKGRFGHPSEQRTISVREAASIQTFPPEYKFDTEFIDKACSIVGNAFPCLLLRGSLKAV